MVWRLVLSVIFRCYLQRRPGIRAHIGLETDHPRGEDGTFLFYDEWPAEWKQRLTRFFVEYSMETAPPLLRRVRPFA